jgi:hypothetical protein
MQLAFALLALVAPFAAYAQEASVATPASTPMPSFHVEFQLITSQGRAMRDLVGRIGTDVDVHDDLAKWTYDNKSQTLRNVASDSCLVARTKAAIGLGFIVDGATCNDTDSDQKWILKDNRVMLASRRNLCLDASVDDREREPIVTLRPCFDNQVFKIAAIHPTPSHTPNTIWALRHDRSPQFQIITSYDKAVCDWDFKSEDGAAAKVNNNDDFTKWTFDTFSRTLRNVGSKLCLAANYTHKSETRQKMVICDGDDRNQQWGFISKKKIISLRHKNLCLEADVNDRIRFVLCYQDNSKQDFKFSNITNLV